MFGNSIARMPRPYADVIKAWADNVPIQFKGIGAGCPWADITEGSQVNWYANVEWRIKPEKVYPETQMTTEALYDEWAKTAIPKGALTNVANAAIRHAIDAGQVVIAEVKP